MSPFSPYGPTIALVFVLLVAAGKAIIEDMKRHKEDRITNNSTAHVVQADGKWTPGALSLSSLFADRDGWRADHVYICSIGQTALPTLHSLTCGRSTCSLCPAKLCGAYFSCSRSDAIVLDVLCGLCREHQGNQVA